jgi:hypothetical protein
MLAADFPLSGQYYRVASRELGRMSGGGMMAAQYVRPRPTAHQAEELQVGFMADKGKKPQP